MMQFAKNRKPIDDWMEHENNSFYHVSQQQYLYVQIPRGVKIDADEDLWIE
ncbi:hypothetical protein P5G51_018285 [Virgibacillus sp. 179-BFC.A HS]|uniref:Uncharacterized protein n=1 Tax=Tigheibacillus jepli TaxID=3035914 RepID=A0ABU5CKZ0_9BACI|nr:hypothetical protein [Virgibacillus sp. 179-BFC.A HS]MDY0407029.1 hypothetical protein [Virgibacillus sp. 179-BFC.A HS]